MEPGPLAQVESRLNWYDRKATRARAAYLTAKIIELGAASLIPIVALTGTEPLVIAGLGALIAVVAGVEQLFRFQETWINYRRTAEALRNELFLYHAGAGPYEELTEAGAAEKLVANRAAAHLLQEGTRWEALAKQATIPDRAG